MRTSISDRGHNDVRRAIVHGEDGTAGRRDAAPSRIPAQRIPASRRPVACSIVVACMAMLAVACDRTDESTVGPGRGEGIAVHAVLDPGLIDQMILVERLLTGTEEVQTNTPFDSLDAVRSGGGVPLAGARVVVYREDTGDSAVAVEGLRSDGRGAGMYRIRNEELAGASGQGDPAALSLLPGVRYRLRVAAADGRVATGTTLIPANRVATRQVTTREFNRDRDSIFIFWEPAEGAARYAVRVESPRGPVINFVDSLEYLISGALRDASESPFRRVFLPGFQQSVTVAAVDANFYDYYRSRNNPYSGRGLVSRLEGALGVFGSMTVFQEHLLQVSADSTDAAEGLFRRVGNVGPVRFRLYVDERPAPARTLLSGFHFGTPGTTGLPGLLGEDVGGRLTLALLREQSASDTAMTIDARFEGSDRIIGTIRGSGQRVEFVREVFVP
ncbi:MAG TPA: hypothetical protein VKA84_17555 [Gemmatimonadaceae bacterium]|nr:hypothetical protein [Gemmatimonadaceae bacterium]